MPFIDGTAWSNWGEIAVRAICGTTFVWLLAALGMPWLRRASAAVRHRAWGLSVVAALTMPLAVAVLPQARLGWYAPRGEAAAIAVAEVQLPLRSAGPRAEVSRIKVATDHDVPPVLTVERSAPAASAALPQTAVTVPEAAETGTAWSAMPLAVWLWLAWALPAGWMFLRIFRAMSIARRMAINATLIDDAECRSSFVRLSGRLGLQSSPRLAAGEAIPAPLCVGWRRPTILLPADWRAWPPEQRDAALAHELAHAARGDVAWQLAARVARALYWFHPLAWLAAGRMRIEREAACDDAALSTGQAAVPYARALLAFAARCRGGAPAAAVAMTHGRGFERRVRAILSPAGNRGAVGRRAGWTLGAAALAVGLLGGVVSPLAAPPEDQAELAADTAAQPDEQPPAAAPAPNNDVPRKARFKYAPRPLPRIVGRVVDESGQPVEGAKVDIIAVRQNPSVVTGADGRFAFDLVDGQFMGLSVRAVADEGSRQGYVSVRNTSDLHVEMEVVLRPARRIAVRVVDAEGRPVAGVALKASVHFHLYAETVSDAEGNALLLVPADAVLQYVWAVKPGVGLDYFVFRAPNDNTRIYLLPQEHAEPLMMVLAGTRRLTLRAVNERGQPLAGAEINIPFVEKRDKGERLNVGGFSFLTDENGSAAIDILPADLSSDVFFAIRHAGYSLPHSPPYGPKSEETELTAQLVPLIPVRLRAVLADGSPAAGAQIFAACDGFSHPFFRALETSDSEGRAEMAVPPNQYFAFLAVQGELISSLAARVIKELPIDEVELVLHPGTRVHGRATRGREPQPQAGVLIRLFSHPGVERYKSLPDDERLPVPTGREESLWPKIEQSVRCDEDGRFEFLAGPGEHFCLGPDGLGGKFFATAEGQVEMRIDLHTDKVAPAAGQAAARSAPPQAAARRTAAIAQALAAQPLNPPTASAAATPADDLAVAPPRSRRTARAAMAPQAGPQVVGRVVDDRGLPVAGVQVEVVAFQQNPKVTTDAAGSFRFDLPDGRYASLAVRAMASDGALQGFFQAADPGELPAEIEISLLPAREIPVRVVDAEGHPVAGAGVAAAVFWYERLAEASTDADGRALLRVPAAAEMQYVWAAKSRLGLDYFVYLRPGEPATDPYRLPPDHDEPIALVLNGARTVTVRVVDEAGQPLAARVNPWYFEKPKKGGDLNIGGWDRPADERGVAAFDFIPADNVGKIVFRAQREGYFQPLRLHYDPESDE